MASETTLFIDGIDRDSDDFSYDEIDGSSADEAGPFELCDMSDSDTDSLTDFVAFQSKIDHNSGDNKLDRLSPLNEYLADFELTGSF
ncbi:MAG TPA: hypothetical protein VF896_06830 [Anaerolineales bacterium]|jgi:hypothetical protein